MATIPRDTTTLTEFARAGPSARLERFRQLRSHLEQEMPLAWIADEAAVSRRTAQRWVRRYRECGLAGPICTGRADRGTRRRLHDELRQLAEGLALRRPPLGPTAIHRELCRVADARGYSPPRFSTVCSTIRGLLAALSTPSKARKATGKLSISSVAEKPCGRMIYGRPITPNLISGPNVTTVSSRGPG
jgi:transposase